MSLKKGDGFSEELPNFCAALTFHRDSRSSASRIVAAFASLQSSILRALPSGHPRGVGLWLHPFDFAKAIEFYLTEADPHSNPVQL